MASRGASAEPSLRRALVFGGTGIGWGVAKALAGAGAEVTVAGRKRGEGQVSSMLSDLQAASRASAVAGASRARHRFLECDGTSLASVRSLAAETKGKVDWLAMTPGVGGSLDGYSPTGDGLDRKLQLHYFSRMHLARLLAPEMAAKSADPRVLTVLSGGVHGKFTKFRDEEDGEGAFELRNPGGFSVQRAADAAGYYTDAGFESLARENPKLAVVHASPGFVSSNWGNDFPLPLALFVRFCKALPFLATSVEACGEVMVGAMLRAGPGFSTVDQHGKTLPRESIKHTEADRDYIWKRTTGILDVISA